MYEKGKDCMSHRGQQEQILQNEKTQPLQCCFDSGTLCIHSLTNLVELEVSHSEISPLKLVAPSNILLYNCRDYQRGRCMKKVKIA